MITFSPQHEYSTDRRVRLVPLGTYDLKVDGGSLYSGVTREEWRSWPSLSTTSKGVDRRDRVTISINVHVVLVPDLPDGGYSVVMYGTGFGHGLEPHITKEVSVSGSPRLEKEMKKVGLKRDVVDTVIIPSFHSFCGGNLIFQGNRGDRGPLCPNAEWVWHADEHRAAMGRNSSDSRIYQGVRSQILMLESRLRKDKNDLDEEIKKINAFEDSSLRLGHFVELRHHPGVTDGYCSMLVTKNSERVLISPILFPTPHHVDPQVQIVTCKSRSEVYDRKVEILEECWRDRIMLHFAMDPGLTTGYINKSKNGEYSIERVGDALY